MKYVEPLPAFSARDLLLFLPEGLVAALCGVGAPIYGFLLLGRGRLLPGGALIVGTGLIALLAYRAVRMRSRVLLYVPILAGLGLGMLIAKWAGDV